MCCGVASHLCGTTHTGRMKTYLERNCLTCNIIFHKEETCSMKRWSESRKYCSVSCSKKGNTFRRGQKHNNTWNKGKTGLQVAWNKGNSEYAKALGFGKWMEGKEQSLETKQKKSFAAKANVARGGHNFYIDGRTKENHRIRNSMEYKAWRTSVFKRDDYTCQDCGVRGVYIEADHIKPFAYFPELRFELSNGQTLCKPCHEKTPTYKGRALKYAH